MEKLKNLEILTNRVYLNIKKEGGDEVETRGMAAIDAIAEYGELEVLSVGDPRYDSETSLQQTATRTRRRAKSGDDTRKTGVTDILLQDSFL